MIDTVKKIISEHTKISIEQLQPGTEIGRSAVGNSIILHRMYAAMAKEGIEIPGYQEIKTFGDLVNRMQGTPESQNHHEVISFNSKYADVATGIGIDIEEIAKMPLVDDFRNDAFYTMNFTPEEISYCVVMPGPYASFAGLFAAKEAIVKADNLYREFSFDKIFIDHLPGGKPVFGGFSISIAHAQNIAVAVAIKNMAVKEVSPQMEITKNNSPAFLVSVIALVIAFIAICISLYK
ncbi:MAG: 4'-phosphopantetheinyl transferase superfamily protein [Ginsengibacter sp.]